MALAKEIESSLPGLGKALSAKGGVRLTTNFSFYDSAESLVDGDEAEHLLGIESGEKTPDEFDRTPVLEYTPGHTWMRAATSFGLSGELTAGPGRKLAGGAAARREVEFLDYRRLGGVADREQAMAGFFANPRFAVRAQDVGALGAGEALSMRTERSLSAKIVLRWSDIVTSELADLSGLLRSELPGNDTVSATGGRGRRWKRE